MGTSMELIQNAYQGFAKQNYTMLDNLKLGYGGTKQEMERLILDAENLDSSFTASRDVNGELAMSYADIVDAIHIVQTDMGILGTTSAEASSTIQAACPLSGAHGRTLLQASPAKMPTSAALLARLPSLSRQPRKISCREYPKCCKV